MITIFTPAYNRATLLPRLFESLRAQKLKDFEWLIVDDGSTDDTEAVCQAFTACEEFPVRYYRKQNSGKHKTVNFAVPLARGEWFIILDSDDYLAPDAISGIMPHLLSIADKAEFAGVMGLKQHADGHVSGGERPYEVLDTDMLSFRTRYHFRAESAEVMRTSVMRAHPFPEFEGEKFIQEAVVWNRIASRYICRYVNVPLQIIEYQPDGLTQNAQALMRRNPCGSLLYFKESYSYSASLAYHLWALGEYWTYYRYCPRRHEEALRPTLTMRLLRPLAYPYQLVRWARRKYLDRKQDRLLHAASH